MRSYEEGEQSRTDHYVLLKFMAYQHGLLGKNLEEVQRRAVASVRDEPGRLGPSGLGEGWPRGLQCGP